MQRVAVFFLCHTVATQCSAAAQRKAPHRPTHSPAAAAPQQQRDTGSPPVAVFLQVGSAALWPDLEGCLHNVAAAVRSDVHVAFVQGMVSREDRDAITARARRTPNVAKVFTGSYENRGADIGQFISQLIRVETLGIRYDYVLKMHTKTHKEWRSIGIQSMCGTRWQVDAVLRNFADRHRILDLIGPSGFIFGPSTPLSQTAQLIVDLYYPKYRGAMESTTTIGWGAFKSSEMYLKQLLGYSISGEYQEGKVAIVAGSMFWARHSALGSQILKDKSRQIMKMMTSGYRKDGGMEHAVERWIPTMILHKNHQLAVMPQAPKVITIYFPQYHPIPENDRFWGRGFTEWTLLRAFNKSSVRVPLAKDEGGLGMYNLMDVRTRFAQAKMAKDHGVHGFMFYHYWFNGPGVMSSKVLHRVPEQMLRDGEPRIPFFFSWANEPWTLRWDGAYSPRITNKTWVKRLTRGTKILLSQEYGNATDWREHFAYLLPFFRHKNYMKINGKVIFVIYRPAHLSEKHVLKPMVQLWNRLANDNKLRGIHWVTTANNFYPAKLWGKNFFDAAFHFLSTCPALLKACKKNRIATCSDSRDVHEAVQYWGAFTGFDNRVRGGNVRLTVPPQEFSHALNRSFTSMAAKEPGTNPRMQPVRRVPENLFFVAAWNEWNEQNVMEPDNVYGFGYLNALKTNLQRLRAYTYNYRNTMPHVPRPKFVIQRNANSSTRLPPGRSYLGLPPAGKVPSTGTSREGRHRG